MYFVWEHLSGLELRDFITNDQKATIQGMFYTEECLRGWAMSKGLTPESGCSALVRCLNEAGWQVFKLL